MKKYLFSLFILFSTANLFANEKSIKDFKLVTENNQLNIRILDEEGKVQKDINENILFVFNGFEVLLRFSNGEAVYPPKLKESTLTFIKVNGISKIYVLFLKDSFSRAYEIPRWWLFLIPILVLILCFLFRKLLYVAIGILIIMVLLGKTDVLKTWFQVIIDAIT